MLNKSVRLLSTVQRNSQPMNDIDACGRINNMLVPRLRRVRNFRSI